MSLEKETGRLTFVNISKGQFIVKKSKDQKEYDTYSTIGGIITDIDFEEDEYQGKKFEKAKIIMVDGEDRYCLQMRVDSGYFRGFCNSLASADDPTQRIRISPSYKLDKDDKPSTTCFVRLGTNKDPLKWKFTKDHPGELPQLMSREWKGKVEWDNTEQIRYWKVWCISIDWQNEAVASNNPTSFKSNSVGVVTHGLTNDKAADDNIDIPDDLPF